MAIMNFFKKLLFARAISFEEGKFTLFGIRGVMVPSSAFAMMQYEILKKDPNMKDILFYVGHQQSKTAIENAKNMATGNKAIIELLTNSVSLMGLGKLDLINPNIDKGDAIFRVRDSAVASEYIKNKYKTNKPVDHYLLGLLHGIEHEFGRRRIVRNEARGLDLDLIDYDGLSIDDGHITLPHPRMHQRAFVLLPLAEIAPDWVHPSLTQPLRQLISSLPDDGPIFPIE